MGEKLNIRAMVYVAAEPIPYFWPMRSFIHHNPLHGLEDMPFETRRTGASFVSRARLPAARSEYQRYLKQGAWTMPRSNPASGVRGATCRPSGSISRGGC